MIAENAFLQAVLAMGTLTVWSAEPLANVSSVVGQNASAVTAALCPLNVCLSFQPCERAWKRYRGCKVGSCGYFQILQPEAGMCQHAQCLSYSTTSIQAFRGFKSHLFPVPELDQTVV